MAQLGMQLIVYRGRQNEDLAGVLSAVAGIGYDGVETGNLARSRPVADVADLFARTGLRLAGVHAGFGEFENPERLEENLTFLTRLGGRYLLCSGVADRDSREGYLRTAAVLNRAGARCREAGVTLCYHNHHWEFVRFDGTLGIELLAAETDPALVRLNIDVFWVAVGGVDPVRFIERYGERCPYYHIKDGEWEPGQPGKPIRFTELGRGHVDLRAAVSAALATGPEWLVYEQDHSYEKDPTDAARQSFAHLRQLV